MKPEPFAWAYQNANTEHQYLVWHKQEGGRNWVPLFTLTDVQEAILAEREACIVDIQMHIPRSGRHTPEYQMAMRMIERIRARGRT